MSTPTIRIETVNPADLGVLDQARADATPDDQLVASVKRYGIMQPPTVAFDPEHGGYVIVMGHRRVGAAIAAGLTEITVLVRDTDVDHDAVKLEQQIVENERRKGLTAAELAQGYQKLQLFGRTPEDIARELAEKPDRVRAGLRIVASKTAAALIDEEPSIDFEQAAIIAEFDEHPKLQKKLIETATTRPENFRRDVETTRAEAVLAAKVAELKQHLKEEGTTLIETLTYGGADWWSGKGVSGGPARTLPRLGIEPDAHRDCPGHAAIIEGASPYSPNGAKIVYVCTDWRANGHVEPERVVEKTPEQLGREAEWARADEERRQRRELINANTRARREWIHGYLITGRLRPTATHFDIMAAALQAEIVWRNGAQHGIILELLTGKPRDRTSWEADENDLVANITDPAISNLRIILAAALAVFEGMLEAPLCDRYWTFLEDQGYPLTDTDREHLARAQQATAEEAAESDIDDAEPQDADEAEAEAS